ncbi:MAG: histidine kinase [Bacteroidetes bacterium]|nr:histidine kinase [Bacteroidota bacterium]
MKGFFRQIPALLLFLLSYSGGYTQPVVLDKPAVLQQPYPLYLNSAVFYLDESNSLTTTDIATRAFHPYSFYFNTSGKYLPPDRTWWTRFEVQHPGEQDTTLVFYPGFQNYVDAYVVTSGRVTPLGRCGNLVPASQLSIPEIRQALVLRVPPGINTFYIRVKNVTNYQVDPYRPYLMTRTSLLEAEEKILRNSRVPDNLFFTGIGMFLIMLVYILIKWLYQKDTTYLYYAITILGSSAYLLFNFFKEYNNQYVFVENPLLNLLTTDSYIFISMFAYWQFVRKFLYLDKQKSFLGTYLQTGSFIILGVGFISLLYALSVQNVMTLIMLNSSIGMIMLCAGVYVLFAIRKLNQPLRRFIYGGIFSLVIFYFLASIYEMVRDTRWEFLPSFGSGTPFLMMGNICEMLFFTVGLAYRNKLETEQVANITLQKAEAEMSALRSQMNPHFIFNCMHTIDAYIFKEQPEKASAFLNKFSRLIRQVLENSQHQLIGLDKELESLELYLKLEQERFDHSFMVRTEVSPALLSQHYRIPPLLLQPYAENAILHGLRHMPASGKNNGALVIAITDEDQWIRIEIADNGIGRAAAQKIKERDGKQHAGMAQELTRQRLERLGKGGSIRIADNTNGRGTVVHILLPKIK